MEKGFADYLKNGGMPYIASMEKTNEKVSAYLEGIYNTVILKDIEDKKWYIVDLGLRNYMLPKKHYDLGFSLENIVYFELLRRNYRVNIGKYGNTEVDFVARRNDVLTYYQVTADMTSETTFEREMKPLREIKDNYEKIVLTLDRYTPGNYDGIKVVHVIDWLLDK